MVGASTCVAHTGFPQHRVRCLHCSHGRRRGANKEETPRGAGERLSSEELQNWICKAW